MSTQAEAGVEGCDDGNDVNTDACLNTCDAASCGDGYVRAGVEDCDDGNDVNTDACLNTCDAASCGDTYVQAGVEDCDDGNDVNTDACLTTCVAASCGDTYVWAGVEECDDGNDVNTDGVDCTTTEWVWSSDRAVAQDLQTANDQQVLWTGCAHANPAVDGCSLDGTGWATVDTEVMAGCNADWYHIGGRYTGNCGGHDGDLVRRLVLGDDECYDF